MLWGNLLQRIGRTDAVILCTAENLSCINSRPISVKGSTVLRVPSYVTNI